VEPFAPNDLAKSSPAAADAQRRKRKTEEERGEERQPVSPLFGDEEVVSDEPPSIHFPYRVRIKV
jgi:hypothetical protein